ncbi:MAG: 30S ribosomal protein S6 [Candidatus Paceibacterota bacterium]
MKFYEFNLLITSSLKEEKLLEFSEKLISELQSFGDIKGEIEFKFRRLAYPIKKEGEAWLTTFLFLVKDVEMLDGIEKKLKEKQEILRYLILSKKEAKEEEKEVPKEDNLEKVNQKVEELLKEE